MSHPTGFIDTGQLKKLSQIALGALCVLFIGAIVFYKERVFFADASYILFNILNSKSFCIQEHRYGSFITQMVPYFGQKWRLPLKAIIVGYAISFNLFYLIVAAILYRCRQYALAIVMGLYYFLFVSASYFWTNNEIHQAVAWMFLLFGVTAYLGVKKVNTLVIVVTFTLLAFLTIFTHFVVIIPTVFLWIYFLTEKDNWSFSAGMNILFSVILIIVIGIKYTLTVRDSYDWSNLHGVTHFSLKDIYYSMKSPVITMFIYRCITNYWAGIILFALGIVALFKEKKIKLAIWTLASFIGYFIIMGLTYGGFDRSFALFHVESEWAGICIIIATPFVFTYLPKQKFQFATGLLISVFLVRLIYIGGTLQTFAWRTYFKEQVLTEMKKKGITKVGLINDNYLLSKNMLYWALPEESMLMSAMNGDKPQLTFLFVNKDNKELISKLSTATCIAVSFGIAQPRDLNREYFAIDTTHPYQIMNYEELLK
jgi:hypothetical protein